MSNCFRMRNELLVAVMASASAGMLQAQSLGAAVDGVCYEGNCTPTPLPIAGSELLELSFTYTLPNGDIYFISGPFSGSSDAIGTTLHENDVYQATYEGNVAGATLPSAADTLTIDLYESYATPTTSANYTSDQIGSFSANVAPNSSAAVCWNVTNCYSPVSPPGSFDMTGIFPNTSVDGAMNFDETYTLFFGAGSPVGSFIVIGETSPIQVDAPTITGIVDAASYTPKIAPGELASIFGTFLTDGSLQGASAIPLPQKLVDATVTVNGLAVPLLYASPSQINFQVPYEAPLGTAQVIVTTQRGSSNSFPMPLQSTAPSVFQYNGTHAVDENSDYSLNQDSNPAAPGSYIITFATGGGAVSNQPADGAAGPAAPPFAELPPNTYSATVNGENAPVLFAGLAPGFVGLLQLNITVPSDLAAGDYPLVITVGGVASPPTQVSIR